MILGQFGSNPFIRLEGGDLLAIHFKQHIALAHTHFFGGAAGFDPDDDQTTFPGLEPVPAGQFFVQLADVQIREDVRGGGRLTGLFFAGLGHGLRLLDDGELDGFRFFIAKNFNGHLFADRGLRDGIAKMSGRIHRFAIVFDNDIRALKSRFLGRTVIHDIAHEHALGIGDSKLACQFRCQFLDGHPQPPTHYFSRLDQLTHDGLGHVTGNRKADAHIAAALAEDRRIDSDQFTADIHQCTA